MQSIAWRSTLGGAAVIVAAAAVSVLAVAWGQTELWIALLVPLVILYAARARFERPYISPVWITTILLVGMGSLGLLVGDRLNNLRGGSIQIALTQEEIDGTALIFAVAALGVVLGGLAFTVFRRKPRGEAAARPLAGMLDAFTRSLSSPGINLMLVLGAALPAALIAQPVGGELLRRSTYFVVQSGGFSGLGLATALGAVAVCGYLTGSKIPAVRVIAVVLVLTYGVIFFGLASRRLALIPIIFTIGMLAGRKVRHPIRALLLAGIIALVLLPLPLYFRGQAAHGILPYWSSLSEFSLLEVRWSTVFNNVLIAFPLVGTVGLRVQELDVSNLLIELNPLPGTEVGWYELKDDLRFNTVTPYPAVGVLANYGVAVAFTVWATIGAMLAYLETRIRHYLTTSVGVMAVALTGLVGLFAIQSLQYPLRSSFRLLIYAIALDVLVRTVRAFRLRNGSGSGVVDDDAGALDRGQQRGQDRGGRRTARPGDGRARTDRPRVHAR